MRVLKEKLKNKRGIIYIIIAISIIGLIITFIVTNNLKSARNSHISAQLTSINGKIIYLLGQMGIPLDDMQSNNFIYDDSVVLVLYDSNNEWLFGIELDKNANKITRIYGSEAKKCEDLFREEFKERLSDDFKVQ